MCIVGSASGKTDAISVVSVIVWGNAVKTGISDFVNVHQEECGIEIVLVVQRLGVGFNFTDGANNRFVVSGADGKSDAGFGESLIVPVSVGIKVSTGNLVNICKEEREIEVLVDAQV